MGKGKRLKDKGRENGLSGKIPDLTDRVPLSPALITITHIIFKKRKTHSVIHYELKAGIYMKVDDLFFTGNS